MTVHLRPDWCIRCGKWPIWMQDLQICSSCYHFLKGFGKFNEFQADVIASRVDTDSDEFERELQDRLRRWAA